MGQVVLVTGVAGDLGRRLVAQLSHAPGVDRAIGVDVVPPRGDLGRAHFVRADIRNPVMAKVIVRERVDTVVHASVVATPAAAGGRTSVKELNVIGTMQLLAACQRAPSVRHLVVKSTTTVYGASNRDPAMFTDGDLRALETDWAWLDGVAARGFDAGPGGMVDDDLALVADWGVDLADVTAPVILLHGDADRIAPVAHARWLADRVPGAELVVRPGDGHISVLHGAADALARLRERIAAAG